MTSEPFNVKGVPSRKFSGLASSEAVSLDVNDGSDSLLSTKTPLAGNKPSKSTETEVIATENKGTLATNKEVLRLTQAKYYRGDLSRDVLARLTRNAKVARRKAAGLTYSPKTSRKQNQ